MQNEEQRLDLTDRRLIYELDRDSRQPVTKIAKKLRISSQTAEYRIGQLQKRGVIMHFPTIHDYKKLGYTWYGLLVKTRPIPTKKKETILRRLANNPNTISLFEGDDRWNFCYGTLASDVVVANSYISQINELFKDYLVDSQLLIHTGAYQYGRRYLYWDEGDIAAPQKVEGEKAESYEARKIKTASSYGMDVVEFKIDETDMSVLKWLSLNARIHTVELAKKIHSNPDVVRYRIKNLVKNGIIKRFTVFLNPEKYGHCWTNTFLKLAVNTKERRDQMRAFLQRYPHTFRVITTLGRYDMLIDTLTTDDNALKKMLDELVDAFPDTIMEKEQVRINRVLRGNYFFSP